MLATKTRVRLCHAGVLLLKSFLLIAVVTVVGVVLTLIFGSPLRGGSFFGLLLLIVGAEFLIFWAGILCVYLTSVQLGVKLRIIGAVCGMIPIVHLIVLGKIIAVAGREVRFERKKLALDEKRAAEAVCATRYPLLLVHGVFFRDSRYLNYWGRIPKALERNGATVYYGDHQSAAAVADSAKELAARIRAICEESGREKVNVIAHSKGGLDMRQAIAAEGIADRVASLTTVNTPHRGCTFADYLLEHLPQALQQKVARTYEAALKKLGDTSPDFMAAVSDLTAESCRRRDAELVCPDDIFTQSIGSHLKRGGGGQFPLNYTYHLAGHFEGPNDGLVADGSFAWGSRYTCLTPTGKRGISHGDVVDLNRENIDGFDVREFYVQLVADLKARGL